MKSHAAKSFTAIACALMIATADAERAQADMGNVIEGAIGGIFGVMLGCAAGAIDCNGNNGQGSSTPSQESSTPKTSAPKAKRPQISAAQRQQNRDVQTALNAFGFPAGTVDGIIGRGTRGAISQYQSYMGHTPSGQLTDFERQTLIDSWRGLQAGSGGAYPRMMASEGPRGLLKTVVNPQFPRQFGDAMPGASDTRMAAAQQSPAAARPVGQAQSEPSAGGMASASNAQPRQTIGQLQPLRQIGEPSVSIAAHCEGGQGSSHPNGGGWVDNTAYVADTAYVGPKAAVCDQSRVLDRAEIRNTSRIKDKAQVSGTAIVRGGSVIENTASISGNAEVNRSRVSESAQVYEEARVIAASIAGFARIYGKAVIRGAEVTDHAQVYGSAKVHRKGTKIFGEAKINSGSYGNAQEQINTDQTKNFVSDRIDFKCLTTGAIYEIDDQHIRYCARRAEEGDPVAQQLMGRYFTSIASKKDYTGDRDREGQYTRSFYWYQKAYENVRQTDFGNFPASFSWGYRQKTVAEWVSQRAERAIGEAFLFGKGVPEDPVTGLEWINKVFLSDAESGNPRAQLALGGYARLADDRDLALYWFEKVYEHAVTLTKEKPKDSKGNPLTSQDTNQWKWTDVRALDAGADAAQAIGQMHFGKDATRATRAQALHWFRESYRLDHWPSSQRREIMSNYEAAGVVQLCWSGGDGLIRPPLQEIGQPEVHDEGLERQHGVGAPL